MSNVTNGKKPISVGPLGGDGGSQFDDGVYTGIRQLVVVHGAAIDSIQIKYYKKGSSVWSDKHGGGGGGGSAGTRIEKIRLDYPDEVLTSLSGYFGSIANGSPIIVQSLAFESNRAKYGPYGRQQGTHFSLPMTGCKIVGFHGRCGCYLDSIGVHLKPLQKPYLSNSLLPAQIGYNVVGEKEDNKKVPGNSSSRQSSDTKEFTASRQLSKLYCVRQINLSTDRFAIVCIEVMYDKHGQKIRGSKHGSPGYIGYPLKEHQIIFNYPHEVLTHISGYHGSLIMSFGIAPTVIKSLTFHTTKRKYGPFGEEKGIFFSSSNIKAGMIVGFHGSNGMYLNSIGVHVLEEKFPSPKPSLPKRGLGGEEVQFEYPNEVLSYNSVVIIAPSTEMRGPK
ncbi:jacalin-related lectin 3 isoform X1 [Cinnamomum micranthum f. kanehirae]|uniref:Jacalin-related lectin 3 isoform X1 n=1 Tax=Cinnamomum micranthum f. kanehirae TaxID=337451 RepID=A0A3S3M5Y8_9MAGN|nr:jacalin-related lectin 3 isoform X1 [Cinnamomum micranthum f. kanehirae]